MIKAVLFDWSGVLVDEIEANARADIDTMVELGGQKISVDMWFKEIKQNWKILFKKYGVKEQDLNKVLPIFEQKFDKYHNLVKLNKGTKQLLSKLKEMKIVVGIISGQPRKIIEDSINRFQLKPFIDFIISGDDVINQKPHIEPLEKGLKKLNCKPEEIIYVDDMPDILNEANKLGLLSIGINSKISQDLSNAKFIINELIDILKIIKTY